MKMMDLIKAARINIFILTINHLTAHMQNQSLIVTKLTENYFGVLLTYIKLFGCFCFLTCSFAI